MVLCTLRICICRICHRSCICKALAWSTLHTWHSTPICYASLSPLHFERVSRGTWKQEMVTANGGIDKARCEPHPFPINNGKGSALENADRVSSGDCGQEHQPEKARDPGCSRSLPAISLHPDCSTGVHGLWLSVSSQPCQLEHLQRCPPPPPSPSP